MRWQGLTAIVALCVSQGPLLEGAEPALVLRAIHPSQVHVGEPFNLQPDGKSALAVNCQYATRQTVIVFDGQPLQTTFGSPSLLSATIPAALCSRPGRHTVSLKSESARSNTLDFTVTAPTAAGVPAAPPVAQAAPPILRGLIPSSTRRGQLFNVQAGGKAALAVICVNASPGTSIVFADKPLTTTFGGPALLTAEVPRELYDRPGRFPVYLKNGRGESKRLDFVVLP